jgi:hypothetical protein
VEAGGKGGEGKRKRAKITEVKDLYDVYELSTRDGETMEDIAERENMTQQQKDSFMHLNRERQHLEKFKFWKTVGWKTKFLRGTTLRMPPYLCDCDGSSGVDSATGTPDKLPPEWAVEADTELKLPHFTKQREKDLKAATTTCDGCGHWQHFACTDLKYKMNFNGVAVSANPDDEWYCTECKKKRSDAGNYGDGSVGACDKDGSDPDPLLSPHLPALPNRQRRGPTEHAASASLSPSLLAARTGDVLAGHRTQDQPTELSGQMRKIAPIRIRPCGQSTIVWSFCLCLLEVW